MSNENQPPRFKLDAFDCPKCGAFSNMTWEELMRRSPAKTGLLATGIFAAECARCGEMSIWVAERNADRTFKIAGSGPVARMIEPAATTAPCPHPDLPRALVQDFEEARQVANLSPRSAAALLRLVVQKLCKELGESGKNINDDIGALVKKGLPIEIQQALDSVRVIGNNSVHPGEMSPDDVGEVASSLFEVVNIIVEERIAKPKRLKRLYEGLPEKARTQIERRDKA